MSDTLFKSSSLTRSTDASASSITTVLGNSAPAFSIRLKYGTMCPNASNESPSGSNFASKRGNIMYSSPNGPAAALRISSDSVTTRAQNSTVVASVLSEDHHAPRSAAAETESRRTSVTAPGSDTCLSKRRRLWATPAPALTVATPPAATSLAHDSPDETGCSDL